MAKSLRSKREKRLRAIRREMVEPLYDQKEAAKQAALEAALAAPKLPVRINKDQAAIMSDDQPEQQQDVDMETEESDEKKKGALKPMGKKMKKKVKLAKRKGKGKLRKRHV